MAHVLIEFEDKGGRHKVGDQVDIPRVDEYRYQRLIDYGIIGDDLPESPAPKKVRLEKE